MKVSILKLACDFDWSIYIFFFTKALYKEYLMKSKESKPDLSCVFCDDPVKTKDLIEHISDKHIEEVCSFTTQIMTEYPSYCSPIFGG